MAMLTNMVAVAATATALHLGPPVDAVPIPPAVDPDIAVPAPLVAPFDREYIIMEPAEYAAITNKVEALWADHTNRLARAAAMKARREETLKAAKAASRKPWRAPKIPHRAPHTEARPR